MADSRALIQPESALSLDATLANAMIGYAKTFWRWQLATLAHGVAQAPESQLEKQAFAAERHAREARRLASVRHQRDVGLAASEALGEALLAQGRMAEAASELSSAEKDQEGNRWVGSNEVRWGIAQAEICAAQPPAQGTDERLRLLSDALEKYQTIRNDEANEELPALSGNLDALDFAHRKATCPEAPGQRAPTSPPRRYILRKILPEEGPPCKWTWVVGEVYAGDTFVNGLFLHVWGAGVEYRIELAKEKQLSIELQPDKKGYYFARLEEKDGRVVSAVQPFDTEPSEGSVCFHNQIRIIFEASR